VLCYVAGKDDYNFGYNAFFFGCVVIFFVAGKGADIRLPLLRGGSRALETRLGFRGREPPLSFVTIGGVGGGGRTVVVSIRWR
jgi:hypothetical protein